MNTHIGIFKGGQPLMSQRNTEVLRFTCRRSIGTHYVSDQNNTLSFEHLDASAPAAVTNISSKFIHSQLLTSSIVIKSCYYTIVYTIFVMFSVQGKCLYCFCTLITTYYLSCYESLLQW